MLQPIILAASDSPDWQGGLIIALFLVMIGLMYTRKLSALLALPLLGIGVALIGGLPYQDAFATLRDGWGWSEWKEAWAVLSFKSIIIDQVIGDGAVKLKDAYTIAIIGGMLAILIREKRIAEALVKYAAELAGDNPIVVAITMMLVVAMLFTSMGGLGAIIMTGTIVLPIMMSLGIGPLVAAGIFLIGLSAGGTLNPGNWALYQSALGLSADKVQTFAFIVTMLYVLTGAVFIGLNLRVGWRRWIPKLGLIPLIGVIAALIAVVGICLWAPTLLLILIALIVAASLIVLAYAKPDPRMGVRPIALLAPLVPIVLSFKFSTVVTTAVSWKTWFLSILHIEDAQAVEVGTIAKAAIFWDNHIGGWSYTGAFFAGLLFTFIFTWKRKAPNIQILTKSIIIGAESVIPAVLLMIGLGIVLNGLWLENVREHLAPYVEAVVPASPLTYVIVFGALAPLALYRGPLNVWGLGLGVAGLIFAAGKMGALPVMAIFMSVGAIQSVCDPTNTHNIWIGSYIGEDVMKILKKTLVPMWAMAVLGLIIAAVAFRGDFGPEAYARETNPSQATEQVVNSNE